MKKYDGGAAFPVPVSQDEKLIMGMSLRDWFAGNFVQGNLSFFESRDVTDYDEIAHDAYLFADAMLKSRGDN